MVQKLVLNKSEYYISPQIKQELDKGKDKVLNYDQDRFYIVDGNEGLGKSTLALQLACYVDPTFTVENVVFSGEQLEQKIRTLPPHSAIVFDEAFNGLSSKGALSKENKRMIKLLMECRQKNMFFFIVLPSFFMLEKYVAIFRSRALFHVFESRKYNNRRFYTAYNRVNKKRLYLLGKSLLDYSKPRVSFTHQFFKKVPKQIDYKAYLKKKHDSFMNVDKLDDQESKQTKQRNYLIKLLIDKHDYSQQKISDYLDSVGCPLERSVISRNIAKLCIV